MNAELEQTALDQFGLRQVLNALADGTYITDCERKIVFWSRAAERITGWAARDVVGHRCADNILVHIDKDGHQLCKEDLCPLHRAILTGELSREPLLVFAQHKQGHRIPVEVSVAPLHDDTGRTLGGIEVFRDLTSMMEDLQRAKVIQDHVLESKLPTDTRLRFDVTYSPEELVGGDFYRVESIDADRYAVMVADVMGHGIASALYTMQLRSLWEECRAHLEFPARFLGELNQRLHRLASPDGYFATAVYLSLNASTGMLRYVRAGHPCPLLFGADGRVQRLGGTGPAVGLLSDVTYAESESCIAPGDTLLLYTDGAIEITGADEQELGEAGLLRLLQSRRTASLDLRQVERSLLDFGNRIRLPDDLTLLSVQRT
jgi:phosphoserine phosphatase RsbU/P